MKERQCGTILHRPFLPIDKLIDHIDSQSGFWEPERLNWWCSEMMTLTGCTPRSTRSPLHLNKNQSYAIEH